MYGEHGLFASPDISRAHTATIAAAVEVCENYMIEKYTWYFELMGFDKVEQYAEHLEANPDSMDLFAVLLTAQLNRVHLCVHHPGGEWHTHVPGKCVCSLHFAAMGNMTFMVLEEGREKEKDDTCYRTTPARKEPPPVHGCSETSGRRHGTRSSLGTLQAFRVSTSSQCCAQEPHLQKCSTHCRRKGQKAKHCGSIICTKCCKKRVSLEL